MACRTKNKLQRRENIIREYHQRILRQLKREMVRESEKRGIITEKRTHSRNGVSLLLYCNTGTETIRALYIYNKSIYIHTHISIYVYICIHIFNGGRDEL